MEGSGERVQPLAMLYIRQTGKLIPARSIHLDLVAVERLNEAHFGALCVCVCVCAFFCFLLKEATNMCTYDGTKERAGEEIENLLFLSSHRVRVPFD